MAFRLVARARGMEFAFLEMISCESLVRQNAKALLLMKTNTKDRPVGCQLVGCNPETMGEAAAIVEEMGYDLIDINFGCPVPKITGPGGGSALLKEPQIARQIFKSMIRKVRRLPVTVKMRLGFADASGQEAETIAKIAEDEGLSAISVHGRTREQGYSGTADWKAIGRIKKAVRIPLFGNGDVQTGQDAVKLMEVSGCDGIMIGRGALGNPWIYREVEEALQGGAGTGAAPNLEDRKNAFLEHFELELATENPHIGLLKCRKIACWYFKGYPGAADLRGRINHCESADLLRQLIREFNPSDLQAL